MDYDSFYRLWNNEIEPRLGDIEMWAAITSLGIKPFKEGNKWGFLYSDIYHESICGFGDTIYQAAKNFYIALCKQQ